MIDEAGQTAAWAVAAFWGWDGWPRAAEVATVVTALSTASVAGALYFARRRQVRAIEAYLRKRANERTEQDDHGFRLTENISRHLGIPEDDVERAAFASRKIVRDFRPDSVSGERKPMWGYRGRRR